MSPDELDDARLRAAYALIAGEPRDRGSCPAPEALLAIVERAGAEDARLATMRHVTTCTACRRELDLLRTAARAARESAPPHRARLVRWSNGLALAASLLVAAGLGAYLARGGERAPVMRGGEALALNPVRPADAGGALVSWRPASGAVRYELTLIDADGRVLVRRSLPDTSSVVADSLVRGSRDVVVSVSAILRDGSTLGPSSARLRPE